MEQKSNQKFLVAVQILLLLLCFELSQKCYPAPAVLAAGAKVIVNDITIVESLDVQ